jgi:xylulokinase
MNLSDQFILAIDHGTSGIKAAIVAASGEIIDFVFERIPIHGGTP